MKMSEVSLKAVIIDDESSGREILKSLLEKFCPQVEVLATANSAKNGKLEIENLKPNLVFLDIEMPNGSGFDLLKGLDNKGFEIIFVTAHNQYAIQAIKASALDYLLKPVNIDELKLAVEKASERLSSNLQPNKDSLDILVERLLHNQKLERLSLPTIKGFEIIKIKEIIYCKSDDNYTRFYLKDARILLVSKTIKTYEELLESVGFMRIHKSHIVNLNEILKYNHGLGGEVEMSNKHVLEVSRTKKQDLLTILQA